MVYTCLVCKWRGNKEPRRSFHNFPTDKAEKKKWLEAIGKRDTVVGTRTSICCLHFEESCFSYGLIAGKKFLKKGCLPTLHLSLNKENDRENGCSFSIEPEMSATFGTPLGLPLPDGSSACEAAIKRHISSQESIEDRISKYTKLSDGTSAGECTEHFSSKVTESPDMETIIKEKNEEIRILHRQIRRMNKSTLSVKAANKNLRCKIKRFEKQVRSLGVSMIISKDFAKNIKKLKPHKP